MAADGKAAVSLQELPTELVALILTRVTDIATLDSLIRAWPAAYRVFESSAVDITEAVLSSGYVCGHIRVIFRIIALLRSGTLPISNLADFRRRVIVDAMRYDSRVRSSPSGFAPTFLARETSPAVIRSLFGTYRQIMMASLGCLTYYLDRFKTLKPEHPIYKAIKDGAWSRDITTWPSRPSRPQGRKFDVRNVGPPSWTEEQRVNRAFWRLQLLYDLKRAASRGLLDWPDDSKAALCDIVAVSRPIKESTRSWSWSRRYGHQIWPKPSDFYDAWMHIVPYAGHDPGPPEYEELISVVDYVRTVHGQEASGRLVRGEVCLAELQGPVEIYREWSLAKPGVKDWKTLIDPSEGTRQRSSSILSMTDFDTFGRYGFAFWSRERMFAYGLARRSESEYEDYRVTYAWESILSPEEVARAELEIGNKT